MKTLLALAAAIALAAPAAAEAPAPNYFVKLTLTDGDKLIAAPGTTVASGDMAGFSGGEKTRYDMHFVATPDAAKAGNIRLQLAVSLEEFSLSGERTTRKMSTVLSMVPNGMAAMTVPGAHPLRIQISVAPVTPAP
jgi:hypothetical protein